MKITIFGLAITSSWGNGHATTYRALVKALSARGHDVVFFERDAPWYADNRDLPSPPYCRVHLYDSVDRLRAIAAEDLRASDLTIVGSYVPDGIAVGDIVQEAARGLTAFYDIDTPVTLARLPSGRVDYVAARQIPRYDLYLSFTGGPTLDRLQQVYGASLARPLYCSVDPDLYFPERRPPAWDLGYLGTYSADRQPVLDRLLVNTARFLPRARFVVAGPQYPQTIAWPANVERIVHLGPAEHRRFYNTLRYALNVTRADMVAAGYSPSVRLFEAAACGTPIVSDEWDGLDRFFEPGAEILIAKDARDTQTYLSDIGESERLAIGARARARVLASHTAAHRAIELEMYAAEAGLPAGERAAS